jgi:hypothetical protein
MMAAAMGEEAEVPVWDEVQRLCRSVVTTFRSPSLYIHKAKSVFLFIVNCFSSPFLLRAKKTRIHNFEFDLF